MVPAGTTKPVGKTNRRETEKCLSGVSDVSQRCLILQSARAWQMGTRYNPNRITAYYWHMCTPSLSQTLFFFSAFSSNSLLRSFLSCPFGKNKRTNTVLKNIPFLPPELTALPSTYAEIRPAYQDSMQAILQQGGQRQLRLSTGSLN
ncbi:hypothetical protein LI328DRAFT_158845 [Trichoderma asperelloides]|nr:hypothetical protein LI328DRAFT_158845 [Trichoderma asperelloides]